MSEDLEKLRYPIGRFEPPSRIDRDQIARWIGDIEALPGDLRRSSSLRRAFARTDPQPPQPHQLDTPYRPRGLDHPPGDSPFAGQSHQQFHPRLQGTVGPDRGPARDQALPIRGPLGGTGRTTRNEVSGHSASLLAPICWIILGLHRSRWVALLGRRGESLTSLAQRISKGRSFTRQESGSL